MKSGADWQWGQYKKWKRNHQFVRRLPKRPRVESSGNSGGSGDGSATFYVNDSMAQLQRFRRSDKVGRYKSTYQRMKQVTLSRAQNIIFRWNSVNKFSNGNGRLFLENSTESAALRQFPVHAIDLTAIVNVREGTTIAASPHTKLNCNPTTAVFDWSYVTGQTSNGTTTSTGIQVEGSPAGTADQQQYPLRQSYLKWIDLRLLLHGCRNKPTKFHVYLCRFIDRDLTPTPTTQTDVAEPRDANQKHDQLWGAMVKGLTYSPIASAHSAMTSRMKVIRRQTFLINDTSADSTDTAPLSTEVRWFLRMDKKCTYSESSVKMPTGADVADQADYTVAQGAYNSCYLIPTQRLYLIVSATAWTDVAGVPAAASTPSFDVQARICHKTYN